ncbi:MAG: F-type H+-transporting ATPase subunit b [Alphaproteobacteria bacterium]|jgi:F-type H+-transporting ATPase subunit b|nr:F-type H+-transporting ATPase subunit b [Alphaproteobacteria bacterium]
MFDAEFWVAVSFFIFVGILLYIGVHKKIAEALDHRRDRIKAELDEARRLREEAQALLAHYRQKQKEAEGEAAAILTGAKADAERMTLEAEAKMSEFVARRTKMAEAKIAQAEIQALADVRAAAADAAVTAAERILKDTAKGKLADELLASGIEDVKNKLN